MNFGINVGQGSSLISCLFNEMLYKRLSFSLQEYMSCLKVLSFLSKWRKGNLIGVYTQTYTGIATDKFFFLNREHINDKNYYN